MGDRPIAKVLLVDDDRTVVCALSDALEHDYREVLACTSLREALDLLERWTPDLLILDVVLPDGSAFEVLEVVSRRSPMPLIIAISGQASADESFRLAQLGVHTFLSKPFGVETLRAAIEEARERPLDIRPHIRDSVGHRPLPEVEAEVRETMLTEAMARSGDCRRQTARLLGMSRQIVQHMVRRRGH